MARPYLGENADTAELNRYTLELAGRSPTDPAWGSLGRGANFGAQGASGADSEFVTINGVPHVRLGDAQDGFANAGLPVIFDPTYGYVSPDVQGYARQQDLQRERNAKEFDIGKMGVMGLGTAGMMAGLGGAFPFMGATEGTGLLSQLGIQNPLSNLFGQQSPGAGDNTFLNNSYANAGGPITDSPIYDYASPGGAGGLPGMPQAVPPTPTFDPSQFPGFPGVGEGFSLGPAGLPVATPPTQPFGYESIPQFPGVGQQFPLGGSALTAASTVAKSALSKILDGSATADDYLRAAGAIAPGVLGMIGANQQSNTLQGISDKYLAMGAPFRDRLEQTFQPGYSLMNEPGFKDALDVSSQGVLRNLSARVGNPADNPGSQSEAMKYVTGSLALPQLNTMRSQLGTFGQLGTNMAGTADMAGANASGGALNAVGYGLSNLLNEGNDLDSLLKKLNLSNSGMKLNLGGGF
jgi:hypothetical protein